MTDTPPSDKPPRVFQSGPSSSSGPSSTPLTRTTSPDQLQQQIEAMRMKNLRLKNSPPAMHDNLQVMHQATEVERNR